MPGHGPRYSYATACISFFLSFKENPKNIVPLLLLEELTINHATMVWYLFYTQMEHGFCHRDDSMIRELMEVINLNKLL